MFPGEVNVYLVNNGAPWFARQLKEVHNRRMIGRRLLACLLVPGLAVSVVLVVAACGGSKQSAEEPQGSADIFSLLETSGDEALDSLFVGEVASGSAFLAIGTLDEQAVAYYCDGEGKGVWFKGTFRAGEFSLTSSDGAKVTAKLKDERVTGQLSGLGSAEISIDITAAGTGDTLIRIPREGSLPRSGLIVANFAVRGTIRSVSSRVQGTSGGTSLTPAAGSSEAAPVGLKVAAPAASPQNLPQPLSTDSGADSSKANVGLLKSALIQCDIELTFLDGDLRALSTLRQQAKEALLLAAERADASDAPRRADLEKQAELTGVALDAKFRSVAAQLDVTRARCDDLRKQIKALGG
jgi:hypothetical protein